MTNEQLLEKLRDERPNQVIHEVLSFEKNIHGFYDVTVSMEDDFFGTKVKRAVVRLPYPMSEYEKLSVSEQSEWRWKS